jgi:hypothetical protein
MLIVAGYFLLQVGRVDALSPLYSWLNLAGAVMILISLLYTFNFSSFVIEVFWILISIIGLVRSYMHKPAPSDPSAD